MLSKKHFDMGDYLECVKLLNAGHGPISDGWEDGLGNACTMDGWGDAE